MQEFLTMMAAPVVMALILVAMHSHLGHHVVQRGVIFVDIALAQVAAFGVAISLMLGGRVGSDETWIVALASTLVGAWVISRTRTREQRAPQEAYIGIVYAVASAAMILLLTQVPHGGEEIRHLLVGSLLWVSWSMVAKTALLYGLLGGLLWLWRRPLGRISADPSRARRSGLSLRRWDFVFYVILGTVVTSSVQVAGVLLVFSLLVVPTVMGVRLYRDARRQYIHAVAVGTLAVAVGASLSYLLDLPTGAAIVCVFGVLLVLQVILENHIGGRRRTGR